MSLEHIFVAIIIDILNIILFIIALYIAIGIYRRSKHRAIIFFSLAVIAILLGPLFELFAMIAPDANTAELFVKISGIGANISVFFLIAFVIYLLRGEIPWHYIAVIAFLEGYLLYDVAIATVDLVRVDNHWTYTRYFTDFGALLIALLTFLFILASIKLALRLLLILKGLKGNEATAIKIYVASTSLGALLVVISFALEVVIPGISRLGGPLGVLIFILGITISLMKSPYALSILPSKIYGYMVFRNDGILIDHKFYLRVSVEPSLLASGLSAIFIMLSEATEVKHEFSIIRLGPLSCILTQKEDILFALFVDKTHPELIRSSLKIIDQVSHDKELLESPIITEEHSTKVRTLIENELRVFLIIPSK